MNKHAFQRNGVQRASCTVFVDQPVDFLVTSDLGGLRVGNDGDIRQAAQFGDQNCIGTQRSVVFDQGNLAHHASQVDGSFNARVAATNHRHMLALEQRAIAMRAVRHTLVLVFTFAGHVDVFPARAG